MVHLTPKQVPSPWIKPFLILILIIYDLIGYNFDVSGINHGAGGVEFALTKTFVCR